MPKSYTQVQKYHKQIFDSLSVVVILKTKMSMPHSEGLAVNRGLSLSLIITTFFTDTCDALDFIGRNQQTTC